MESTAVTGYSCISRFWLQATSWQAAVHLLVLPRARVASLQKLTCEHLPMLKRLGGIHDAKSHEVMNLPTRFPQLPMYRLIP